MIRAIVAADAANYLRTHGARCAARLLDKLAVGVVLSGAEWADVLGDANTVVSHTRSGYRHEASAYSTALMYLSHSTGSSDDRAVRELADLGGVSIDEWLSDAREAIAWRAA